MPVTPHRSLRCNPRRPRLLPLVAAIGALAGHGIACAQYVPATTLPSTPTLRAGGASVSTNVGTSTQTITQTTPRAVIDWSSFCNCRDATVQVAQPYAQSVLLYAGLTGQWASKNLDGAEKLTLGGARAVRAYPTAEAPSDEGVIVSTELRYFVNPSWTVFGLYDWAKARLRKRHDEGADKTRFLDGAGIGV